MKLYKTAQAELDLIEIWQFIAIDNPKAATQVLKNLDARSHELLDNPELGPARPDIADGYRHLVDENYLILYHIIPKGIEVVRYIHGARDLQTLY